jgi:hypothetical protein
VKPYSHSSLWAARRCWGLRLRGPSQSSWIAVIAAIAVIGTCSDSLKSLCYSQCNILSISGIISAIDPVLVSTWKVLQIHSNVES